MVGRALIESGFDGSGSTGDSKPARRGGSANGRNRLNLNQKVRPKARFNTQAGSSAIHPATRRISFATQCCQGMRSMIRSSDIDKSGQMYY